MYRPSALVDVTRRRDVSDVVKRFFKYILYFQVRTADLYEQLLNPMGFLRGLAMKGQAVL